MADLTVSSSIDAFMQAANQAAMLSALNITLGGAFATSGAFAITLTVTGITNVTLPTSGTLAVLGANTFTGVQTFTPTARTSGSAAYFTLTTPTDTTLAASTEAIGFSLTAATRQFATGAITTQRERVFASPTYSFVGASTITNAYNLDIGEPIAGTNATLTNKFALKATSIIVGSTPWLRITESGTIAMIEVKSGFLRFSAGGTRFSCTQVGITLTTTSAVAWGSENAEDLFLYRQAADILAQRRGTNAQCFKLYGTYTDASNYVRLALNTTSTTLSIVAETAGTGADDIDLILTPAGTGSVRFGTHSAIGAETLAGYITIKDSGGTSRKLAVVS